MSNYVDSDGGHFDGVSVGGGIISGDIRTPVASLNNTRQIANVVSGTKVTIKVPLLGAGGGTTLLYDNIKIRFLMIGYGYVAYTLTVGQGSSDGSSFGRLVYSTSEQDYINRIADVSPVTKSANILSVTFTSKSSTGKFTTTSGLQIEYTANISTVTIE